MSSRFQRAADHLRHPELTELERELLRLHHNALREVADAAQTLRSSVVRGAVPRQLTNGQSLQLSASAGVIAGWSMRETSGTATALVQIYDNGAINPDRLIASLLLNASESRLDWLLPAGISYVDGLFVNITGAVEGIVYLGPVPA